METIMPIDKIPISAIGELQKIDVQDSTGVVLFDGIARICTIYKPKGKFHGDLSPFRMAEFFDNDWRKWYKYNDQFIVQVSGCY